MAENSLLSVVVISQAETGLIPVFLASLLPPFPMDDHKATSSIEKGGESEQVVDDLGYKDSDQRFDVQAFDRVQRRLKQRHVQMIAIAGTLGTGLFLGSGGALATAGPLGALIAYIIVGSTAYAMLISLAEMTTWAPISGTFPHFAARWVDPSLGFALGWNYFYSTAIGTPVEINAAVILLTFWDTNINHAGIYTAVMCVCVCAFNILGVRYFGESEFVFSLIKICLILGLILAGIIVDLGGGPNHERIGFRFWDNPGPFNRAGLVNNINTDRFIALLSVFVQAAFSFQGMELVCIAASETENPRRNITKAVRRVFYRIFLFYILGIIVIGMLVSYDDPDLLKSTGTAAQSPFVIAMTRAGVKVFPHIINGAVFSSAFSAGNSFLFCSSRILYGLALRGHAPHFFTYCTKKGLPLAAVIACSLFSLLAFMNIKSGSEKAFHWFVFITTTAGFTTYSAVSLTYIFFYKGLKAQGLDRRKNYYSNRFQPFVAYWSLIWSIFFILITGLTVFFKFNASDFVSSYINIPIFAVLYFGHKIVKRTKIWAPKDRDFATGIPSIQETELPDEPPRTLPEKVAAALF